MDGITALGACNDAVISTVTDYRHHLKRNMLLPLQDLRANLITTLLVVVVRLGHAKPSRGTDYVLPLWVADPTISPSAPVPVSIFRRSVDLMPKISGPGDIVYLEGVKTGMLGSQYCVVSNFITRWQIHHATAGVEEQHPLLAYMRRWWLQAGTDQPTGSLVDGGTEGSVDQPIEPQSPVGGALGNASPLPGLRSAATQNTPISQHTVSMAQQTTPAAQQSTAIVPQGSASRFNNMYLKKISDMCYDKFADLLLEVLHVGPLEPESSAYGGQMQQCVVTDYTENALLAAVNGVRVDPPVPGRQLAWCTVHQIDRLNKMPPLVAGGKYWMRNVRGAGAGAGLRLVVSPHVRFPRTIMVIRLEDEHPDLAPMAERRRLVLEKAVPAEQSSSGAMERELEFVSDLSMLSSQSQVTQQNAQQNAQQNTTLRRMSGVTDWSKNAAVTSISSICASQQLHTKFHVRARISGIFPATAAECIVSVCTECRMRFDNDRPAVCAGCMRPTPTYRDECQFMLELADGSATCLAMCPDAATAARVAGCELGPLRDGFHDGLLGMWAWVRSRGESEFVDLLVAPVIAPGPADKPLVRCLLVADIARPISLL
ncbi:hypothetical protein IWW50_002277 [Coemansia erecta]|nr:hypothetical protein IWW50_002277 [Coemansia erecta]